MMSGMGPPGIQKRYSEARSYLKETAVQHLLAAGIDASVQLHAGAVQEEAAEVVVQLGVSGEVHFCQGLPSVQQNLIDTKQAVEVVGLPCKPAKPSTGRGTVA